MKVKQEKPEDKEILALAEQIAAENKNRLAASAQQQQKNQLQVGQSILGVLRSKVNNAQAQAATATATTTAAATLSAAEKAIDEESISGHFGWEMLGKSHMAYILRNGEKYCSVRMAEMKALNKFLVYLHQDIYNCTRITSYYLTEAESRLLNEINFKHCDQKFGREHFTKNDVIVRFEDAKEFHAFLCFCYTKLVNGDKVAGRSGFIQINKESVVPYTLHNNEKYVPLFYFEGETENLKQKVNKIEGWDLSYLKFCCKVQGIRNELFAQDSCSVISLEDIRSYFPPGTHFEDFWPKKGSLQTQLLVGTNNSGPNQSQFAWTKQPDVVPVTIGHQVPTTTKPVTLNHLISTPNSHLQNLQSYSYRVATQNPYTNQVRNPSIRSYTAVRQPNPSGPRQMSMHNYYGSQGPPPLVPTGRPIIHFPNSQMNSAAVAASEQVRLNQMNYHHNVSDNSYNIANRESVINQQSTSYGDDHSKTNGQTRTDSSGYKIIPELSPTTSSHHIPYAMQNALILDLPSINLKPYKNDKLLVTLSDVVETFFDSAPVPYCESVMKVLKIDLYKPNTRQMEVLFESGKCLSLNEVVPLVLVNSVVEYMPQLKYMLAGILSSKRQRVS